MISSGSLRILCSCVGVNTVSEIGIRRDLGRITHPRHGAFDRVTADNEPIALVRRPSFQQLSADTALHESRACHHNARSFILEPFQASQIADVFEDERVIAAIESGPDVFVHRVNICLVDSDTFAR